MAAAHNTSVRYTRTIQAKGSKGSKTSVSHTAGAIACIVNIIFPSESIKGSEGACTKKKKRERER